MQAAVIIEDDDNDEDEEKEEEQNEMVIEQVDDDAVAAGPQGAGNATGGPVTPAHIARTTFSFIEALSRRTPRTSSP